MRPQLKARGVRPVFVHLGSPERARPYFDYYQLGDVERVSDPSGLVYQHPLFALPRVHWLLHFTRAEVWSAWLRGALARYGFGLLREDAHQMPGIFFLKGPAIVRAYRYRTIADTPDYLKLIA